MFITSRVWKICGILVSRIPGNFWAEKSDTGNSTRPGSEKLRGRGKNDKEMEVLKMTENGEMI